MKNKPFLKTDLVVVTVAGSKVLPAAISPTFQLLLDEDFDEDEEPCVELAAALVFGLGGGDGCGAAPDPTGGVGGGVSGDAFRDCNRRKLSFEPSRAVL